MLGPTLVVLVQVESALVLLDGFSTVPLPGEGRRWPALVAGAVLVLITAAQLATLLSRWIGGAQWKSFERRLREEREIAEEIADADEDGTERPSGGKGMTRSSSGPVDRLTTTLLPARRTEHFWDEHPTARREARRIVRRFGLEPSWAFQQLDRNVGLAAARRLGWQRKMVAATWAGHATAALLAYLAAVLIAIAPDPSTAGWVLVTWTAALTLGQILATASAGRRVLARERDYYAEVEALLEVHRFDLYRALAVRSPRDSGEEQRGWISAWRQGAGQVPFEADEEGAGGELRHQVAGLADLLRGPQLVPYTGFISWRVEQSRLHLAFARTPVLDGGAAELEVRGEDTGPFAPFDVTANSAAVELAQSRLSVQAPTSGDTVRTSLSFSRQAGSAEESELWLEIGQRGRFLQLIRVPLSPAGDSAEPPRNLL